MTVKSSLLWLAACGLFALAWVIWAWLPPGTLSLSGIQHHQQQVKNLFTQHPLLSVAGYFALYVIITALSIPASTLLTLLGGACFHLLPGTLLVSLASTSGATLAMLMSRYLLRDQIQHRFGATLTKVNQGMARDGIYYLLALRLMPLFPYSLVNLLMGPTRLPVRHFWWVTQLGMLPATLVYVNAGQRLASLTRLSDIISLPMMVAFLLLGALPLISRLVVKRLLRR